MSNAKREVVRFFDMDEMANGLRDVGGMHTIISADFDQQRRLVLETFKTTEAYISSIRKAKFGKDWERI